MDGYVNASEALLMRSRSSQAKSVYIVLVAEDEEKEERSFLFASSTRESPEPRVWPQAIFICVSLSVTQILLFEDFDVLVDALLRKTNVY